MTVLHRAVADAVAEAARPLLLSGDCPTGLAVAAGLQQRHGEIAVVWLDALGTRLSWLPGDTPGVV